MNEYRELSRAASDTIPIAACLSPSLYLSFSMNANLRRDFRSREIRGKSKSVIKGAPGREINRSAEGPGRVK